MVLTEVTAGEEEVVASCSAKLQIIMITLPTSFTPCLPFYKKMGSDSQMNWRRAHLSLRGDRRLGRDAARATGLCSNQTSSRHTTLNIQLVLPTDQSIVLCRVSAHRDAKINGNEPEMGVVASV